MKKLMMLAAAMTIVSGAFAQCGDTTTADCALVYDVKIVLKTTGPGLVGAVTGTCGDTTDAVCYRVPKTVTLRGLLESCTCDCQSFLGNTFWLWNTAAKTYEVDAGNMAFPILNTIGKRNTQVEANMVIALSGIGSLGAGTIQGTGFGTWSTAKERVTAINGYVIALLAPPECEGTSEASCIASVAYPCGTQASATLTVGYGTWAIAYNATYSRKLASSGVDALPLPNYN